MAQRLWQIQSPPEPRAGLGRGVPHCLPGCGRKRGNVKAGCGPSASKDPNTPKPSITGTASGGNKELVCNRLGPYNCIFTTIKEKKTTTNKKNPARLTVIHFQGPQSLLIHLTCRENCLKWGSMPVSFPPGPPAPQHLWTEWGQAQVGQDASRSELQQLLSSCASIWERRCWRGPSLATGGIIRAVSWPANYWFCT